MSSVPLARSLLARQSQANFPRSPSWLDFHSTRSIDREDVSKRTGGKNNRKCRIGQREEEEEEDGRLLV